MYFVIRHVEVGLGVVVYIYLSPLLCVVRYLGWGLVILPRTEYPPPSNCVIRQWRCTFLPELGVVFVRVGGGLVVVVWDGEGVLGGLGGRFFSYLS